MLLKVAIVIFVLMVFQIIFFRGTKIVLRGNNSAHLFDLEDLAIKAHIPHYLVHDAGKTQVCSCMSCNCYKFF